MRTYLDCYACFLRHGLEAARIAGLDEKGQKEVLDMVLGLLQGMKLEATPPEIAGILHRKIRELSGLTDPYKDTKAEQNSALLRMLPVLESQVKSSPDPVIEAVKIAGACNAIDMGPTRNWDRVEDLLNELLHPRLGEFDLGALMECFSKFSSILYVGDNAGEIVGDKLLVSMLRERFDLDVTFAVRGAPILNDATTEDAEEVGIQDVARVITTGSDCPGAILSQCSDDFREVFENVEFVIAKGQGNYEALDGTEREDIFFLLQVKCPVVARDLSAEVGEVVLRKNRP